MHEVLRENHRIDKRYLALVEGVWPNERSHVKFKLLKYETPEGERRVKVHSDGLTSQTTVNRKQVWADQASLLECELKTGRTHQIRVHLSASGHAILGDDKYGDLSVNKTVARRGLKRMFLHAWRLSLDHPLTGERMVLEAPLPVELQSYLDILNSQGK